MEYDFWVLIETNPQVRAFCERPLKIEQMYEGKLMKVMFDMWVEWENKNEQFVEIRYSNKSDYSGQSARSTIAQQWCEIHEKEIRGNKILLSNMKTLLPYINNRPQPVETDMYKIERQLSKVKRCSIASLSQQLNINPARIRESIFLLIYNGRLKANIDSELIGSSLEVWLNDEK